MIWALIPVVSLILLLKFIFVKVPVCPGGIMKPKIEDVLQQQETKYNLLAIETPVLTGLLLRILTYVSYTRFGKYIMLPAMLKKNNITRMGQVQIPEKPTFYPVPVLFSPLEDHSSSNREILNDCMEKQIKKGNNSDFHLPTVADYVRAYRSGKITPSQVAKAVLDAIAESDKGSTPLRAIVQTNRDAVLSMAAASDQRWKDGSTLSYLDGIPVSIKEEFCCEPYEFRGGASFVPIIGRGVPEAACVVKLKAAGAVIIGMANMHEFGTGTIGSNPHPPHLMARNPCDPKRYAGGSSTGGGISVAAGFCPISIGGDGGGSIRVPAALCGTVGLKPTQGIVDPAGILPKCFTVGVTGPLTSSVLDTAVAMDVISQDTNSGKTLVCLTGLGDMQLDGLKVGIYWDHFNDADEEIKTKCRAALSYLKELGVQLVDITIPEMEDSRVAHVISIGADFVSSLGMDLDENYSKLNPETHIVVGSSSSLTAIEYVNSQKQRTRAMIVLKSIFEKVDMIATPAVACPPPEIHKEDFSCGVLDGVSASRLMRFSFLGNLTGIPGLVVPVGYTTSGLPVGLQLMSSWYREDVILKTGYVMEQSGKFPARRPKVFYDVMNNV